MTTTTTATTSTTTTAAEVEKETAAFNGPRISARAATPKFRSLVSRPLDEAVVARRSLVRQVVHVEEEIYVAGTPSKNRPRWYHQVVLGFLFFFFLTGSCRFSPLPKKMEFRGRKKIGRGGNKKTARRWFLLCFVFLAIAASCGDTPKSLHPPSPQNKNKRQTIH